MTQSQSVFWPPSASFFWNCHAAAQRCHRFVDIIISLSPPPPSSLSLTHSFSAAAFRLQHGVSAAPRAHSKARARRTMARSSTLQKLPLLYSFSFLLSSATPPSTPPPDRPPRSRCSAPYALRGNAPPPHHRLQHAPLTSCRIGCPQVATSSARFLRAARCVWRGKRQPGDGSSRALLSL